MITQSVDFTGHLRTWRKFRKMSQLELALAANVSQRHVSWLETARSQPSRDMVLRLSDAMDVPLRERNQLLNAAGYANVYSEGSLDEPAMESVKMVLENILKHHEPYPAFVLDRHWNIKMQNTTADRLLGSIGDPNDLWVAVGDDGKRNIALLTVHPNGIRPAITNWNDIAGQFMRRLKKEAIDSADPSVMLRYEQLVQFVELPNDLSTDGLLPMLPLKLQIADAELSFCSVISTLGTAQDITANELRVETFYPADHQTEDFFESRD